MTRMTKLVTTLCVSVVAAFGFTGTAAAQVPPGNQAGDSLVNVQVGDITILAPISVAAALCDVNVNVLAQQLDAGDATCEATAESVATPGTGGNGGGNEAGDSLVNVQIGDITALIPISVAAAICDVNVNVLARQLRLGEATCEATGTSNA
ncbi:MAG TPA: hypothetical protein VFO88_02200 [Gaiellaceae bacterium]|nr:hypothetical protein [Gaiellaceae bacterium]